MNPHSPRHFLGHLSTAAFCAALTFVSSASAADTYSVNGARILKNGAPWVGGGVDSFDQTGFGDKSGWNIKVVREIVDEMSICPISSSEGTKQTPIGWLHPLEDIVNNNRAQGMITILCPFGWDAGSYQQILNLTPSSMPWYASFKTRLAAIAQKFAGQSDVWIDVWNEPYDWTNNGFTDSQWLSDMNDLYHTIRNTGNNNIILIPGQAEDTQEAVLLNQGPTFLAGKTNVVASIHCYNAWTGGSQTDSENRIRAIHAKGWALIFGEAGQDQYVSDVTRLLNASVSQQVPTLGWSWNGGDGSKLVSNGAATTWGNMFLPYLPRYIATNTTPVRYEAENLAVANFFSKSGGTARVLPTDSNLSNSSGSMLDSNDTGDYVTYVLPNVATGSYNVKVGVKKNSSRGQFQLQVGRADNFAGSVSSVGPVVDEYASSTVYTTVDLGTWAPGSTSDKWFRFNVAGRNASSSGTSYNDALCIDYIQLTPQ